MQFARVIGALIGVSIAHPQDVQSLITQLRATNPELAQSSRDDLVRLGPAAVPSLAGLLDHPHAYFRWRAAEALAILGPSASPALPGLIRLLNDSHSVIAAAAADALAAIGDRSAAAAVLATLKKTKDPLILARTAAGLGKLANPPTPEIVAALTSIVSSVPEAAGALADVRSVAPELIPVLEQRALTNDNYARALGAAGPPALTAIQRVVRSGRARPIISVLESAGPVAAAHWRILITAVQRGLPGSGAALASLQAADAMEPLRKLLHGPSTTEAATALIGLGQPEPAIEPLRTMMNQDAAAIRLLARIKSLKVIALLAAAKPATEGLEAEFVNALAAMVPESLPVLEESVLSSDAVQSTRAINALVRAGSASVPALLKLITQPRLNPRRVAVMATEALGRIGPGAGAAVSRLSVQLDSADPELRIVSAEALAKINAEGRGILRGRIRDDTEATRVAFIAALGGGSPVDEDAALLTGLLDSADPGIRHTVYTSLARSPRLACLALARRRLTEVSPADRRGAYSAIAACSTVPVSLLPALTAALADRDVYIRRLAALGIRQIGRPASPAVPALIEALGDTDLTVRRNAMGALGAIGPAAASALPFLKPLLGTTELNNYADCAIHQINESLTGSQTMGSRSAVPVFAWPPFAPAARFSAPPEWFDAGATLRDVHRRISAALDASGYYDRGVYALNDGFAQVTAVERIRTDGSPFNDDQRWTQGKIPVGVLDIRSYLETLLRGQNQMYRMIVFAVTGQSFNAKLEPLKPEIARKWVYATSDFLPQSVGVRPFAGLNCHVLIYTFSDRAEMIAALPGRTHLERAGLYARLQPVAR